MQRQKLFLHTPALPRGVNLRPPGGQVIKAAQPGQAAVTLPNPHRMTGAAGASNPVCGQREPLRPRPEDKKGGDGEDNNPVEGGGMEEGGMEGEGTCIQPLSRSSSLSLPLLEMENLPNFPLFPPI